MRFVAKCWDAESSFRISALAAWERVSALGGSSKNCILVAGWHLEDGSIERCWDHPGLNGASARWNGSLNCRWWVSLLHGDIRLPPMVIGDLN